MDDDFRAYDVAERIAAVKGYVVMAELDDQSDGPAFVAVVDRAHHRSWWVDGCAVAWSHEDGIGGDGRVKECVEVVRTGVRPPPMPWMDGYSGPYAVFGAGCVSVWMAFPPDAAPLADASTIPCGPADEFYASPYACRELLRIDAALDGLLLAALEANGQGDRARRIWELGRESA